MIPAIASLQIPFGKMLGEVIFCFDVDQSLFRMLYLFESDVQNAEVLWNPCLLRECLLFILDLEWPVASPVARS
jgi:hypothetical protein